MNKEEKYRNEIKYCCSEMELQLLESRIRHLCRLDSHVGSTCRYSISSIYFDDHKNTYYYENENGTDPRQKFRIRMYDHDRSYLVLECKKKKSGMTLKQSCPLTEEEYHRIMQGGIMADTDREKPLLFRFLTLQNMHLLQPKVIVNYERVPYIYEPGNVRITFDRNISSSADFDNFGNPELKKRPIMPVGKHILEIKYDEFLPDYLYNVLQIPNLTRTNFSKYYLCRKYSM